MSLKHSRCQNLVEFIEQLRKLERTEKLMRFAQPTSLAERRIIEIVWLDADRSSDVVPDKFQPCALLGREHNVLGDVSLDPLDEALVNRLRERLKNLLTFEGKAHKRDEISEATGLRAAFTFFSKTAAKAYQKRSSFQAACSSRSFFSSSLSIGSVSRWRYGRL